MQDKNLSCGESWEETAKMHRRAMRDALISGVFFIIIAIGIGCWLLTHTLSVVVFESLVFLIVICLFLAMDQMFEAGRYYALKQRDPELAKAEQQRQELIDKIIHLRVANAGQTDSLRYQMLKDEFHNYRIMSVEQTANLLNENISLKDFLRGRDHKLFAEFVTGRSQQPQSAAEELEEEQKEN